MNSLNLLIVAMVALIATSFAMQDACITIYSQSDCEGRAGTGCGCQSADDQAIKYTCLNATTAMSKFYSGTGCADADAVTGSEVYYAVGECINQPLGGISNKYTCGSATTSIASTFLVALALVATKLL